MKTAPSLVLVLVLVQALGCSGETAKDATGLVVGKAVELSKGATSGIVEGIEQGRKGAPSVDGAIVVTSWDDLVAHGAISVLSKQAPAGVPGETTVELAIENKGEEPMRLSGVEVLGLDRDGFALKPTSGLLDQTVPPKAKVKAAVQLPAEPVKVAKLRIWSHEIAAE